MEIQRLQTKLQSHPNASVLDYVKGNGCAYSRLC